MRFMMLMIPSVKDDNWMPSAEAVGAMTKFNQDMIKAGVMLTGEGLHPPSKGARVSFGPSTTSRTGQAGQRVTPKVTDGPFAEAKEVIGGYWMIQAKSKAEAVEWARRCPAAPGDVIEIRQVFELADFPEDVQKAAGA
jgi:hypothetical protein